ncbi:phosphotransferase family protein [Nocardia tengchongensis]|uniref:phosphotransferase family protein n=1 Tax=Nocardia tengchongensis TaxID=2055889 RepID=UPI0036895D21
MTDIDMLLHPKRLGPALAEATGDDRWRTFGAALISGGKSNLTFLLHSAAGELVLRRPPEGELLPSAHDMRRETRVQHALADSDVPVARVVLAVESPDLIGVPFYVMSKVHGHIIRGTIPAGYADADADRVRMTDALVDTLAQLHRVDPAAVGLSDFGRPEGFLTRQLHRWQAQSAATRTREVPVLDELARSLTKALPTSPPATLVHGDYRLDNCMMDSSDPGSIAAVLDWEMSTLGDPLTDLGLLAFYWTEPGDPPVPLVPDITAQQGFPPRAYLLERYAARTGHDLTNFPFYEAFARFKFAVILQGIAARSAAGAMGGQQFGDLEDDVVQVAASGLATLHRS